MQDLRQTIAKNIKNYRDRLDLSQEQVAARAKLSHKSINRAEKAKDNLRVDTLEAIAMALEIPLIELVRSPETRTKPTVQEAVEVISEALGIEPRRHKRVRKVSKMTISDP